MNLNKKKEEIIFRIQHQETLLDKVKSGKNFYKEFSDTLDKTYPLHVLGHDKLAEILRENENCNEFYIKKIGKTFQCSSESIKGAKKVNRKHLIETKSALNDLIEIRKTFQWYEEQIELEEIIKKSQKKGDTAKQKAFLIGTLFSGKIKKLPNSSNLQNQIKRKIGELEGLQYVNKVIEESKTESDPEQRISFLVRAKNRIPSEYYNLNTIIVRFLDEEIAIIKEARVQFDKFEWLLKNNKGEVDKTQLCIFIKGIYELQLIGKSGNPLKRKELIKIFENLLGVELEKDFDKLLKQGLTAYKSEKHHIGKMFFEIVEMVRNRMCSEK